MSSHSAIDSKRMYLIDQQTVQLDDPFDDDDLILDLGGGGEGVIGQMRGRQVVAIDHRRGELEEAPPGPIKIIGDAKDLPFLDASFDVATAFFFFMYVPAENRAQVMAEAFRVLRPGGHLHIWDVSIPARGDHSQELFVVPVKAVFGETTVQTGYGVPWADRRLSQDELTRFAEGVGFILEQAAGSDDVFELTLRRPVAEYE